MRLNLSPHLAPFDDFFIFRKIRRADLVCPDRDHAVWGQNLRSGRDSSDQNMWDRKEIGQRIASKRREAVIGEGKFSETLKHRTQ
jgi:hypothetical protein